MRFSPDELSSFCFGTPPPSRTNILNRIRTKLLTKKMIYVSYQPKEPKQSCPLISTTILRSHKQRNVSLRFRSGTQLGLKGTWTVVLVTTRLWHESAYKNFKDTFCFFPPDTVFTNSGTWDTAAKRKLNPLWMLDRAYNRMKAIHHGYGFYGK